MGVARRGCGKRPCRGKWDFRIASFANGCATLNAYQSRGFARRAPRKLHIAYGLPLCFGGCIRSGHVIGELEVMSDRDGAIVFGWVAPQILYAQFIELLSAPLGMRFARRLEEHLISQSKVAVFFDLSGLETYEFPARNALARVLFVRRRSIASALVLVRSRVVELGIQAVSSMIGGGLIEVITSRADFVARLDRAAPLARRYVQNPRAWVPTPNSLLPRDRPQA